MAQSTFVARAGDDVSLGDVTVDSLVVNGVSVVTAVLLASGQVVDLNGETDALVIDADGDTTIGATGDDQIDIKLNGALDFSFIEDSFQALSGSVIQTDTIDETTSDSGVTIDGLLIKDGAVGAAPQAIAGDGAITIAYNAFVVLSKGSAAAITIADPTAGTHDGWEITVTAISAQAHVITNASDGFNAKGSSGTATFGGAIGDSVTLRAYNGSWYVVSNVNVTIA